MAVPAFPTVPPPFITAVTIVQRPRLRGMGTTTIIIAIAEGGDMFRRRPLILRRSGAGATDRRRPLRLLLLPAAAGDGD